MSLVPEFFVFLGIPIFLVTSLITAILDDDFPFLLQYLFQGAGATGLAVLLIHPGGSATSVTNLWIGILYLSFAVASEAGVNVYLAIQGGKLDLVMTLCGFLTVPIAALTAIIMTSYFGPDGDVSLTPTTVMIMVIAGVGISLSISGFFRDSVRHIVGNGPKSSPTGLGQIPVTAPRPSLRSPAFSNHGDDGWEESPKRKGGEE